MCALAVRHAPANLARARSVLASPVVPVGLHLSRARRGTQLSCSYRRPPTLPGRERQTSFCSPRAVMDPRLPLDIACELAGIQGAPSPGNAPTLPEAPHRTVD